MGWGDGGGSCGRTAVISTGSVMLTVRDVFCDGYIKCVSLYYNNDIFDTYEFIKGVYNMPDNRNAVVRRLYIFADGHDYRKEDVQDLLLKYGVVLMPLFVPTSCSRYADESTMSDLMLTMYSPVLAGLWKRALTYIAETAATTSHPQVTTYAPVELHVQKDCSALRDIRQRVSDYLYRLQDMRNRRVFVQIPDSVLVNIERLGGRNQRMTNNVL